MSIPNDPAKAAALTSDPNTAVETLAELAKSDLVFLRENIARHPNASPELLQSLVPTNLETDADHRIARALVFNPYVPSSLLATLMQLMKAELIDGSRRENRRWEDLVIELLSHKNCAEADAMAFLQFVNLPNKIKIRIAECSLAEGVLKMLLSDTSEKVRRAVAARNIIYQE